MLRYLARSVTVGSQEGKKRQETAKYAKRAWYPFSTADARRPWAIQTRECVSVDVDALFLGQTTSRSKLVSRMGRFGM